MDSVELEEQGIRSNTVTNSGLRNMFQTELPNTINRILDERGVVSGITTMDPPSAVELSTNVTNFESNYLNGRYYRLPLDYKIPPVTGRVAYLLWYFGDIPNRVPPLKKVENRDFSNLSNGKRLTDLRKFCNKIDNLASNMLPLGTTYTRELVGDAFDFAIHTLNEDERFRRTVKGRSRRLDQLGWRRLQAILI